MPSTYAPLPGDHQQFPECTMVLIKVNEFVTGNIRAASERRITQVHLIHRSYPSDHVRAEGFSELNRRKTGKRSGETGVVGDHAVAPRACLLRLCADFLSGIKRLGKKDEAKEYTREKK